MIQYYITIRDGKEEYWRGKSENAGVLLTFGALVLPLGNKKPRNVSRETLKEF